MNIKTLAAIIVGIIVLVGITLLVSNKNITEVVPINKSLDHITITPIDHASMVIQWDGQNIAVDPIGQASRYEENGPADIIFLTDIHGDHLSTSTLQSLQTDQAIFVTPEAVMDQLGGSVYFGEIEVMDNGDVEELAGFTIKAIPMYNVPETADAFHPKGRGNGYVIEKDGVSIYVAGDTGNHRLVRGLKNIDVAFIPMNEPYTMSVQDAAEATLAFTPRIVYPYHYRGKDDYSDIEDFKELINKENPEIEVRLVNWYPERELGTSLIQKEEIDPKVQKAFEAAASVNNSQAWQDFIRNNKDHPLADDARYELRVLRGIE